jgi:hypothetical protein
MNESSECRAAAPAVVVGASRPRVRGQGALAIAGKTPALPGTSMQIRATTAPTVAPNPANCTPWNERGIPCI